MMPSTRSPYADYADAARYYAADDDAVMILIFAEG